MTVEADIFNLLTGLVAGRVYPDLAPLGAARPYITYQQIGGRDLRWMDKAASAFQARAVGAPISTYEPDTKLYGSMQDFSVWSLR